MPRPPYIKVGAEDAISRQGSVFASSTLREQQGDSRGKTPLPANSPLTADAPPLTQTPYGQPCSTGVGNNPLTIKKPSQRTVSRMPKARRSRLSLTRRAGWAIFPLSLFAPSTRRKQRISKQSKLRLTALDIQPRFTSPPRRPSARQSPASPAEAARKSR